MAALAEGSKQEEEEDFVDDDDLPLPVLFAEATDIYKRIVIGGVEEEAAINRCMAVLDKVASLVRLAGVFSPNESADDIQTNDLQYLLVDYMVAKLIPRAQSRGTFDPRARLAALRRSKAEHIVFLARCDALSLLEGAELDFYNACVCNIEEDEDDAEGGRTSSSSTLTTSIGRGNSMDPNRQRTNKIERFKRQKSDKERLEALVTGGAGARDTSGGLPFEGDEELAREYALLRVTTAVQDSLGEVDGIGKELQMLEMMAARLPGGISGVGMQVSTRGEQNDSRLNQRLRKEAGIKPVANTHPPPSDDIALDPNRPGLEVTHFNLDPTSGMLSSRKENIKVGVFQPGHRLPTMTIEELADIEVAAALERQRKTEAMPASGRRENRRLEHLKMDGDEDDKDLADEAAAHDRAWDDWKDEHPKGSGNKANKRF